MPAGNEYHFSFQRALRSMAAHFQRALRDIRNNGFLNALTIFTIALSILVAGAFSLVFSNVSELMQAWEKGIRVIAYLRPDLPEEALEELGRRIEAIPDIEAARFVSRDEALETLRAQMKRQSSFLQDLKENPLPDAFELRMRPSSRNMEQIERLVERLRAMDQVQDVEYGQRWLGRVSGIFELFRLSGYGMAGLVFLASVFIVANTTRLVLYSRREEIEIMRMVGADGSFIRAPFYFEGLIQAGVGGTLGLASLWMVYRFAVSRIQRDFVLGTFSIQYLSSSNAATILGCSMLAGWLGCFLSLRQYLKE